MGAWQRMPTFRRNITVLNLLPCRCWQYVLLNHMAGPAFLPNCTIHIHNRFPVLHQLLSRLSPYLPIYWFSGVRSFYFLNLSTSLSHFISSLPLLFLLSDDQVNICLGHHLSPMCNECPYHFNKLFSILSATVFFTPMFWMFLQFLSKNPFLYLTAFPSIYNPLP